jgi:succinoglycan biosynthesis transport protein ExoP
MVAARPDGHLWPVRTVAQPDILKVTPRPMDLVYALRRRWGWALGLGILAAGATAVAAWFLIPVNYTATAWLRIADSKPSILYKVGGEDELLNDRRAVATLMTSRFVLTAALRRPNVSQLEYLRQEDDKLSWLKENVQVNFLGGSQILQIGMTGDDPSQLVTLVNAVQDAYMEEVVGVDRENQLRRKRVLEQSYHRNQEEIKKKTNRYRDLADELKAADSEQVQIRSKYILDTAATLGSDVTSRRNEIRILARRIGLGEARLKGLTDEPVNEGKQEELLKKRMLESYMVQEPWIANARNQIVALDAAIFEEKQRAASDDAPSIVRMQDRIKTLQEGIAKRVEEIQPQALKLVEERIKDQRTEGFSLAPRTPREQLIDEIENGKLQKGILEEELKVAEAAFKKSEDEATKLGTNSAELETFKTELNRLKLMTDRMGTELDQWEVELAAPSRVTVLERASVPKKSDISKKYRMVSFCAAAAFGLAVLCVAGVDFMSRRVNSPAEVAYGLGVRVMGDVPAIGRWRQRGSLNGAGSPLQGFLAESIDNIRTALLYRANADALRVAMVTSSLEKEGKTTVASQLAASLARSGRRTLLIDGDLRRPSAHRLFELPVGPGLSEILRGEADLDDVIRPTRVAGLWMIPAGRCDQDAVQSLASDGLRDSFVRLRAEFDFIMIDSGPVLTDSDALLFGRYADAVLLSVLRDVSRVPQVFEACERIRAVNIPLLGAVVNGVSVGKYRSYYRPYTAHTEPSVA